MNQEMIEILHKSLRDFFYPLRSHAQKLLPANAQV